MLGRSSLAHSTGLAVVTGASGGIGRAVALALAAAGHPVLLVARRAKLLDTLVVEIADAGGLATACAVDLLDENAFDVIARHTTDRPIGVVVHSAAAFARSSVADSAGADFDRLFALNVRVPLRLTQLLLPGLIAGGGQIVFMNSSAGLRAGRDMVMYSATKHALRAVADTLRLEMNEHGVRVMSVYCGRVATPMQAQNFAAEGRPYRPELLTQPEDVAEALVHALDLPATTEMTDLHIRPAKLSY